jgi:hypothetical protein
MVASHIMDHSDDLLLMSIDERAEAIDLTSQDPPDCLLVSHSGESHAAGVSR